METILYGFQISPGLDDEFSFHQTLAECQEQTLVHRVEIKREEPELYADLGGMAVYRFTLRQPTQEDFLVVLNERKSLLNACVVERQLVALVVD